MIIYLHTLSRAKLLLFLQTEVEKLTQKVNFSCTFRFFVVPLHPILQKTMDTLRQIRTGLEEALRAYDRKFTDSLSAEQDLLNDVLRYISAKRGKQLRPILVLEAARLCNCITDKTISTAVALELLHTASLVHDDVVDDSPTRRGQEAVHAHWSNKVAVLAGDYMLAKVIGLIAEVRNTKILGIISDLGRSLSSGEILQLHKNQSMWIDEAQYIRIIEQKTARLFAACCEAGAESAAGSQRQVSALREFGNQLGLCFQIKDDVLDYSDSEDLGKPTMNDIRDGKATLPLIISLQRAPEGEAAEIRRLTEALVAHDNSIDPAEAEQDIKAFVLRFDGIGYAHKKMMEHKRLAEEALSVFHDCDARRDLLALLDYTINRVH